VQCLLAKFFMETTLKKIAFITGLFPAISETWMINQVAGLKDRGIEVEVFSLRRGDTSYISDTFYKYGMGNYTHYLDMPENKIRRFVAAIPKALHILTKNPMALARAFNIKKYGRQALSLELLFWAEPFVGKNFDLFHCHFGSVANRFLAIKYVLGLRQKIITTFYGQDVSKMFQVKGDKFYDELKKECDTFVAMSNYMKKRLVAKGFDEHKLHVLPIFGIDVNSYPFKERTLKPNETIQIVSVGRFVEKKGFDDLLRALAIVKTKADKKFICNIIGGGPLESRLQAMTKELDLQDVVSFKGYMKVEEIINYFLNMHLYLQPSKTASDGDQE